MSLALASVRVARPKTARPKTRSPGVICLTSLADGQHFPCDFVTEDTSIRCVGRIQAERLEHVAEIHSRGFDLDQHLRLDRRGNVNGLNLSRVELPAFAGLEP